MNRRIKKIIAITLTISALSAVIPATNLNLITMTAYATSNNDLTSLKLKTSGGSTIETYDDDDYKNKNKVDANAIKSDKTYYAKTSLSKIKINTDGASYVRIFKGTSNSNKGVKTGDDIKLSSGTNSITVRVYSEDPGTVKYNDKSKMTSEYKLKVKHNGSSNDDNDNDNDDDVYLKNISLSNGDISFSKKTSTYSVNVDESVNEVKITAKPDCDSDEYDNYEVRIDGTTVDEDDNFRKTVSLSKGKNEIDITVEEDNDNKRTYTLNITRNTTINNTNNTQATATSNAATNVAATTAVVVINKANQWVQTANGAWQYNDSTGNPMKNQWVQNYYLQADGNMATGWLTCNGVWYYLGSDGAKKIGWQSVGGNWYYLDSQGVMQIGWIKDSKGKYYHLQSSGAMDKSTTIGGYKLGADGAWIR